MEGVIGFTTMFAGNFAPKNWATCQGQIINIASNTALFSILGTVYGGNGTTTFGLPDLQGRYVVGAGNGLGLSPYALGQKGGSETVTLSTLQMPAHVHSVQITASQPCLDDTGNTSSPEGAIFAANGAGYSAAPTASMRPYAGTMQMTTVGSDTPYEILPAYMAINYIICMYGVFPARN
jgi:microcystin-dependent protein